MIMNIIELTGLEETFLGLYLIAHGGIHLLFLFNFYDEKSKKYTGWSGKSWLLEKVLPLQVVSNIGKITWLVITILFVVSGLGVLDFFILEEFLSLLIILASALGALAFFLFFNGLGPTPYHWILGVVIDLALIIFLVIFPNDILLLLPLLGTIFIWAVLFHNRVIPQN